MTELLNSTNGNSILDANDLYFIIPDMENNFNWVINLEDHPNSFLLNGSHHRNIDTNRSDKDASMVVIQPNF
ncbi:MAG: hypothetical protein DRJ05_01800 [Bacteroidetes bacterium]|nr:MAG: hypothetical protein DRJ05_01800 [Bacteroidota bacterium]